LHRWYALNLGPKITESEVGLCRRCPKIRVHGTTYGDWSSAPRLILWLRRSSSSDSTQHPPLPHNPIVRRTRLHPPAQFFQPLSHLEPALFTSTTFAVRMMDFQQGQQIASQLHIHLAGDSVHLPTGHRVQCGELISKGRRLIMSQSPQPEPSSNLGATLGVVPPRKIRPRFHTRALDTFSSPGARTPVRRKSNARA
jgi:hypothetical protein